MTVEEQWSSIQPKWKSKEEEKSNQTVIEKQCKFYQYGHGCINELQWGYCKYLHDKQLKKASELSLTQTCTPEDLCKIFDISDDDYLAYRAAIRYAPNASSITAEEIM